MRFLGNVLATIVGLFVFCMIFFFGIILIGVIAGSGSSETVTVKSNSVIQLDLSKVKYDYAGKTKFEDMPFFNDKGKSNGLFDIISAIEYAKTDKDIKGISILNDVSNLGIAQT